MSNQDEVLFWNLPNQLSAFNGDTFVENEFIKLRDEWNITNAVETGSYMFGTTLWLSDNFDKVYTFEIDNDLYNYGQDKISEKTNIKSYLSNSAEGLGNIINELDGNTIFFLDAHWYDYCPLKDELEVISKLKHTPLIAIHDFKTPYEHLGFDSYKGEDFTIDFIIDELKKIYPNGFDYHYNNQTIGGASRGLIYITPKVPKKDIVIIDSYVFNNDVETKLLNQIDKFRSSGYDVLLVSNSLVDKKVINRCDYFIYDSRNQLFNSEYDEVTYVNFFKRFDYFTVCNFKPGLQRHGLSVLINIHNAVNFAKSLGYENFLRIEADDIFGDNSIDFMKSVPVKLNELSKKTLLLYNENPPEFNISFHFMYFNIDHYLSKISQIRNEDDYKNYLQENFRNNKFQTAEDFIYNNLKLNGDDDVLVLKGGDFQNYFTDCRLNTSISLSNLDKSYDGCVTSLYKNKNDDNSIVLFSTNSVDKSTKRLIKIYYKDRTEDLTHELPYLGSWVFHVLDKNTVLYIEVYDLDRNLLLYKEENSNLGSYVEFD